MQQNEEEITKNIQIKNIWNILNYESRTCVFNFQKNNYYFGSLSAIYNYLNEDEIGIKKNTLMHRSEETTILTEKAIITKSIILRCKKSINH